LKQRTFDIATCMYYNEIDPFTKKPVAVAKGGEPGEGRSSRRTRDGADQADWLPAGTENAKAAAW
jgi:hypothetical protein